MVNLIIFGPPGAGKGTQSVRIAQKYQLKHISTGEILREEVRIESKCGRVAKVYMDEGKLVPDEVLINILRRVIDENRYVNGFIFDGFPRTLVQAEELDKMLHHEDLSISLVLSLIVDHEELIERLYKRALQEGRADDKARVIHQRLETYNKMTAPLLDYFEAQGKLATVPGIGTIDDIFQSLYSNIDKLYH
ncbi:MAG: adenylate kinase [Bacteroidetes bacterium]|nr:adenylate kinase [Bacteroidota bacterium]